MMSGFFDVRRALDEAFVKVGAFEEETKLSLSQNNVARMERINP